MTDRKIIYLDDAMLKVAKVNKNKYANMSDFHDACVDCLKDLPSAQPKHDCVLTTWGECLYTETGCSDCGIKAKITKALSTQAIKDCRNCKYGKYNDHYNANFCYSNDNCVNWDKWEPSEHNIEQPQCDCCNWHDLEAGDTLYIHEDWDGGVGFAYIRDIQYCPVCGRRLPNG